MSKSRARILAILAAMVIVSAAVFNYSNGDKNRESANAADSGSRFRSVLDACRSANSESDALQYFSQEFILDPLQRIVDAKRPADVELEIESVKLLVGACLRTREVIDIKFVMSSEGPTLVVDFDDAYAGERQRYSFIFVDNEYMGPKIDGLVFDLDPD